MACVYSFCFWFSLRLGGIIIGLFSLSALLLIVLSFLNLHLTEVQEEVGNWMDSMNLLFTREYLLNFKTDPQTYITFGICSTCLYIVFCMMYIYGAYKCSNMLMGSFIVLELLRLVTLSAVLIVWLLVLKQNTMDIGLLIGASVACGFLLLGLIYLWVCAASLPVLINEMERDEQAATIDKLQKLLQTSMNPNAGTFYSADDDTAYGIRSGAGIFTLSSRYNNNFKGKPFIGHNYTRWN